MNPARPWLSIIIPVCDQDQGLTECLNSLAAWRESSMEVIVAGQIPADARALAQELYLPVSFLNQPGAGAGQARNLAAMRAQGELLFFTLPDCRLPPGLIGRLKELFADPALYAAGGEVRPYQADQPLARLSALEFSYEHEENERDEMPCPAMACSAFRASAFKTVGMGNERLKYGLGRDHDLCARLQDAGGVIIFDPELWVSQALPSTWRQIWRRQIQQGETRYQELRSGLSLRGSAYLQPILLLAALGFLAFVGPNDPGQAITLALLCLLLLYPANRAFLKSIVQKEPSLIKPAFLFCLLRPAAWVLGMLKTLLVRIGLRAN
jgi:cellulose synthase/poly-beta-1,6-N-acetylglucosamine synthase-like glycosyltransferase